MNMQKKNVLKLCSFYVSEWHLITMLLPYINKKVNEETKIATILENDIKDNVELLVQKLNLKNEEKVLNIDWKSKDAKKYSNISKIIEGNNENNILIIVNGNKEYIKEANENIQKDGNNAIFYFLSNFFFSSIVCKHFRYFFFSRSI